MVAVAMLPPSHLCGRTTVARVPILRSSFLLGALFVAGLLVPLAVVAAVTSGALGAGSSEFGTLKGAAVPLDWQRAQASSVCPEVPVSVLGALGFVATGSGRWATRPPPWAETARGPLGLGVSQGSIAHQIALSTRGLCWLVTQSDLMSALVAVTGSRHEATVIGVVAAALNEAPLLSASRAEALSVAASAIGLPYRWGGNGPDSYDCSGLMVAAWRSVGVEIPRTAQGQHDALLASSGAPGDLVFYGDGPHSVSHVGMWVTKSLLLDAPETGAFVRLDPLSVATAVSVGSVG